MGLLDQVLAADSFAFTDTDTFGEAVTLTLRDGTTRSVSAFVDRGAPVEFGPQGYKVGMQIGFRNHATLGLLPTELDGGGVLSVTVAGNYGETAVARRLTRTSDPEKRADAGIVWCEVG
jgi:hypothetical protein